MNFIEYLEASTYDFMCMFYVAVAGGACGALIHEGIWAIISSVKSFFRKCYKKATGNK